MAARAIRPPHPVGVGADAARAAGAGLRRGRWDPDMSISGLAGGVQAPSEPEVEGGYGTPSTEAFAEGGAGAVASLRDLPPRRQRRVILDLLRAGKSDTEIGAQFALSQWQVRNLRYRLGLKKDRGGRVAAPATRAAGLEQELGAVAGRIAQSATEASSARRRLPRMPADDDAERMAVRLAGRFDAGEAGRRLSALGGLLSASEGRYEVRLAVRQLDGPGAE